MLLNTVRGEVRVGLKLRRNLELGQDRSLPCEKRGKDLGPYATTKVPKSLIKTVDTVRHKIHTPNVEVCYLSLVATGEPRRKISLFRLLSVLFR